jgi:hypothetical protein
MQILLQTIRSALLGITNPRFYDTERGFQGELLAELRNRLPALELDGAIVEQEYQKRIPDHGFRIRPDIIIHTPFEDTNFTSRTNGNFVVIELKHRANRNKARADYHNLSRMCQELCYPLAIFINIDSDETFIDECPLPVQSQIYSFAVKLINREVVIVEQSRT